MTKILETERLTLRPMTVDDMPAMFEIYSDARAMTFMPTVPHQTLAQTQASFHHNMASEGAIQWAICLKGTDKAIGHVHYLGQTRIQGMGYILHPDYWGQGITTEACRVALDYGFTDLGYDKVELWIDEKNSASSRVAQKLGFNPKGQLALKYSHETEHHISVVWGLRQDEWLSNKVQKKDYPSKFFSVEPVLNVYDVVATADYYRDKLGFNIDFLYGEPATHAGISRGEWSGSMVSIQLSQVTSGQEIIPSGHLHVRVDSSIDTLANTYRANGVEIISEPDDKPWGLREFTIKDLNGHILIFGTYV